MNAENRYSRSRQLAHKPVALAWHQRASWSRAARAAATSASAVYEQVCLVDLVFTAIAQDFLMQFLPENNDSFGRVEAQSYSIAINAGNDARDVIANHDGFANFPCKH